jgi:hypothetical protein
LTDREVSSYDSPLKLFLVAMENSLKFYVRHERRQKVESKPSGVGRGKLSTETHLISGKTPSALAPEAIHRNYVTSRTHIRVSWRLGMRVDTDIVLAQQRKTLESSTRELNGDINTM